MGKKAEENRREITLHIEEIQRMINSFPQEGSWSGPRLELLIGLLGNAYEKGIELRVLEAHEPSEAPEPVLEERPVSKTAPEPIRNILSESIPEPSESASVPKSPTPEPEPVVPEPPAEEVVAEATPEVPEEPVVEASPIPEPEPVVEEPADEVLDIPVAEEPEAETPPTPEFRMPEPPEPPKVEQPESEQPISMDNLERDLKRMGVGEEELNERLSKDAAEKSVVDRIQKQPIANLRNAIALNERFLFANELFNGNQESFLRALDEMNDMASYAEASRFLEHQQRKFNWDTENPVVSDFFDLVERRFL